MQQQQQTTTTNNPTGDNMLTHDATDDGIWHLHIVNCTKGLQVALALIKQELIRSKYEEQGATKEFVKDDISNFIMATCRISDSNTIKSEDLRKAYLKHNNLNYGDMSPQKFGRLMTDFINDTNLNVYGIARVAVRSGTAYKGIRFGTKQIAELSVTTNESPPINVNMTRNIKVPTVVLPKIIYPIQLGVN